MPKSFNLAKVLSRLGIRGAITTLPISPPDHKYEGFVPMLRSDGTLDPNMVPVGAVTPGSVFAEDVGFDVALEIDSATNVRDAINNITKSSGGIALVRESNLSDLTDSELAFNTIKQAASLSTDSPIIAGTVVVAAQAAVAAGTDTATDPGTGSTLLAVSPSTAKTTYLSKIAAGSQTLAGPLVLSGAPTVDLHAATKLYVDTGLAALALEPTGNMVWVDKINGNDTTATRGQRGKPAITLKKAKDLAVSGDTIVVGPGTYNENELTKNGVKWYFEPGAKVTYTTGGSSDGATIFNVAPGETLKVFGFGEFRHMHSSSGDRYVLYVQDTGICEFNADWVQSARSAIMVDCGATGYAQINIADTLISDDNGGNGSCAARFKSGNANLNVGRLIHSVGTQWQIGVEFGSGAGSPPVGAQVVTCPRITGGPNAVFFHNTTSSRVVTDSCYSDGAAVLVTGGLNNVFTARRELYSVTSDVSPVEMTAGRLNLQDTVLYILNASDPATPGVHMNGSLDTTRPYLILENTEIWGSTPGDSGTQYSTTAIGVNHDAEYKVRIIGSVQSDCVEPTVVTRVGGTWDHIDRTLA